MIINHIKKRVDDDKIRLSANIKWENADRENQTIFFETDKKFKEYIFEKPDSFLTAATIPALIEGEERVRVDEACPVLIEGLMTAAQIIKKWYKISNNIKIQAKKMLLMNLLKNEELLVF